MTGQARIPVVLLHALPLDARMWAGPLRALRADGHQVFAHDQRGFGDAPLRPDEPDLGAVADDVAAELDRHGVESALVAGCSMGGYVAMALLRRHPERIRALALLSTRAAADSPQAAADRRAFADLMLDPQAGPGLVDRTTPLLLGPTSRAQRPVLAAAVLEQARAADPRAVAWAQRAVAARPDCLALLADCGLPLLIVAGAEDTLTLPAEQRELALRLPGARFATVPGAGHLLPLEAPEAVSRLLTEFAVAVPQEVSS